MPDENELNLKAKPEEMQSDEDRKREIESIVARAKFSYQPTNYSKHYEEGKHGDILGRFPEYKAELEKYLKDRTIIDLGCGTWDNQDWSVEIPEYILDMAIEMGAKEYIGVDQTEHIRVYPPSMDDEYKDIKTEIKTVGGKEGDMLTFLSQHPDNSANIMVNGIDYIIIDQSLPANVEYLKLLAKEIKRVIGKDHRVFGLESQPIFNKLRELGLEENDFGNRMSPEMFWNKEE